MADLIEVETSVLEKVNLGSTRRQMLARAGLVGAAAIGMGLLGGKDESAEGALTAKYGGPKGMKYTLVDADILNFALNLEYLEAEFYQKAVNGVSLADIPNEDLVSGTGALGTVSGGTQVTFTNDFVRQYGAEIALDELNHVRLLRSVLGKKAVARPSINLDTSFSTAAAGAAAAAGITLPGNFSPYAGDADFLLGAFIFEDVGVTAYHGGAPYIFKPAYLSAAAGILAVEAYHAATVRTLLFQLGQGQASPNTIDIANAISAFRGAASAAADATATNGDQGITNTDGSVNIVPTDGDSLVFARTFAEVLNIVYLGGATNSYGFFPNKLNGKIS